MPVPTCRYLPNSLKKPLVILDSIDVKYPGNSLSDDILMAKARILIQQKNYNDAIVPLKKILPNTLLTFGPTMPFLCWAIFMKTTEQ